MGMGRGCVRVCDILSPGEYARDLDIIYEAVWLRVVFLLLVATPHSGVVEHAVLIYCSRSSIPGAVCAVCARTNLRPVDTGFVKNFHKIAYSTQ